MAANAHSLPTQRSTEDALPAVASGVVGGSVATLC